MTFACNIDNTNNDNILSFFQSLEVVGLNETDIKCNLMEQCNLIKLQVTLK